MHHQFDDFFHKLKRLAPTKSGEVEFLPHAEEEKFEAENSINTTDGTPISRLYAGELPYALPFARNLNDVGQPVAAVDAGVMRLGESAEGIVIALRGAIIVQDGTRLVTGIVRSGPIFLAWEHETELLAMLGSFLGDPSYYIIPAYEEGGILHPAVLKNGVGGRKYLADRFRAGLERHCHRLAATAITNGTLLVDGSLTLRSRDTPDTFLNQIAFLAGKNGTSIIGLSKKSELVVGGKAVTYWLDDQPPRPCYRALTPILQWEDAQNTSRRGGRAKRVMGNVYAARLSPLGPTMRMDVKGAPGVRDETAIDGFYRNTSVYCGYPSVLARAHAACYVSSVDFLALQTQATREYGLRSKRNSISLQGAFFPFGGTFK